MLKINVTTAEAVVTETELITAGRKGLRCAFTFSDDWAGLAKTVIVQGAATRDIALLAANEIVVPAECVDKAQFPLKIGVYGALPDGTIAIPTIWASFGKVLPGAKPSDIPPDELTPDVVAQIQEAASNALYLARNVQSMADAGEFDGAPGDDGVSPSLSSSAISGGHRVSMTDKDGTTTFDVMDGATGAAATISIGTTATLDAGSDATVTNSGTSEAAVLNFGIPKGDQGTPGQEGPAGPGITEDFRAAILQLASKVAYIDENGADYYQDLYDALYPTAGLLSITAVFTQGSTVVYDDSDLDDLRTMLYVVGHYDDNTDAEVTNYTLSGNLTAGTSTVNVSYLGKTTTFTVTVTARPTLSSISAVYTQSGTVLETDSLDSLKTDLVVTATYSDSSTETVPASDYTLSGTLTVGTSTITVSYSGLTTTFTVTVTAGTEMLITNTYATSSTGGTWVSSTPPFRVTTSGTAGWSLTITPNTTGLTSPKISDMLGHRCRLVVTSDWASSVNGSALDVAIIGTSSNNGAQSRGAYKLYVINPDSPNLDTEFVVSQAYFTNDTSKYKANHYFTWRVYAYSNAGADVTFDVHLYDLGLEA